MTKNLKIVFLLLPEKGHINPYIGPAQALIEMGHDVFVAAPGNVSAQFEAADIPFLHDLVTQDQVNGLDGRTFVELIRDKNKLSHAIEGFLIGDLNEQVRLVENLLKKCNADRLVIDPMFYAATIAAEKIGIRWAAVSSSLSGVLPKDLKSDVLDTVRAMESRREELFLKFGFRAKFNAVDVVSSWLNITFATEEFVGRAPDGIELVGPSLPLGVRGDEVESGKRNSARPLIYVSFGSQIFYVPEVFKKIIEAVKGLEVELAMAIGDLIDEPEWQQPIANCTVYRYAPQSELLNNAVLFVSHGGANSVMESLVAGVPMLISPFCNDQFHQAHIVEQSGVGRVLDLQSAQVSAVRRCIENLLSDNKLRDTVSVVSQSYKGNGAIRAARLISERERTPTPV